MSSTTNAASTPAFRTLFGAWRSTSTNNTVDLEAQTITGTRIPLDTAIPSPPPRATISRLRTSSEGTDPIDDFFGVTRRGTQDSRHDVPASPAAYAEDMEDNDMSLPPPPYADSSDLPSYTAVAEPPTLAMYLFKFGFIFPLFWFAGILIMISPLNAPDNWEPTKTEAEREELIELLRRTERKWAKRCLWASMILAVIVIAIAVSVTMVMRA